MFIKNNQISYLNEIDESKNFVNYINSLHNLNASGVNVLAESQIFSKYFKDIYTPFAVVDTVKNLINGHNNNIIILTGHAGDGKSTIAFDILQYLDRGYKFKSIREYEFLESHNLNVLKDMSEISVENRSFYLSRAFGETGNWIIVSNTGPLLTSITEYLEETSLQGEDNLSKILGILSEDLGELRNAEEFNRLKINVDGKNLYIINIAKLDNIEIAIEVFRKIIRHQAWDIIMQQYPHHPIARNYKIISDYLDEITGSIRLTYLYLLNYECRLTLRQMLAHLSSSITMGYNLADEVDKTILFSEAFFGYMDADIWHKSKNLKIIELMSKLNLGGYTSLEVENIIANFHFFDNIREPLKSISQKYIQRDKETCSTKIKSSLRRMLYMYDLQANLKYAKALFLDSPNISKFSSWRLNSDTFDDDARDLKKDCLKALNLFYSDSHDAKNLNITLKRADGSVYQIAQIRICSIPESIFTVSYDNIKKIPFFHVKSDRNIRLDLNLPLLDYIRNILDNDISDSLNPIYKTQLEKFKLSLIENYSDSESDIAIVRMSNDGTLEVKEIFIKNNGIKVSN